MGFSRFYVFLVILLTFFSALIDAKHLKKSELLCRQCSSCDTNKCPPSESYPHMTAYDDSLISAALQSDYVSSKDRKIYSVPNFQGADINSYYGWESSSGSASGYHR